MKISIVTVSYNCDNVIEETLQSVINQTYNNIEYIVIDGKSTDSTVDIIKKYSFGIDYWISEPDKGVFDAMNKSLLYVTGDYVIFMNAGDCFVNNHVVEDVFEGMDYDEDLIFGDVYYLNNLGYLFKQSSPIYLSNPSSKDFVFKSQGICHQSLFTKASILKTIKFDLRFPLGADYYTTAKVFYSGNQKLKYVGFPIAVFDDRTGGISHNRILKVLKERSVMFDYSKGVIFWIKAYTIHITLLIKKIMGKLFSHYVTQNRRKKYIKTLPQ